MAGRLSCCPLQFSLLLSLLFPSFLHSQKYSFQYLLSFLPSAFQQLSFFLPHLLYSLLSFIFLCSKKPPENNFFPIKVCLDGKCKVPDAPHCHSYRRLKFIIP